MPLQLYGLLHLAENEKTAMNLQTSSFAEQITTYLKNAVNLSESLRARGIEFVVLTNRKDELNRLLSLADRSGMLTLEELNFTAQLPSGLNFFSDHYKVEVFQYFASMQPDAYVGLIDLDVIAINDFPPCFEDLVKQQIPLCYDISDQMIPAYGYDRIIEDMQRLLPNRHEGRWYGGEFIMGSPAFFQALSTTLHEIFENYLQQASCFHHQGSETLLSVALEKMRQAGHVIADAGPLGIIGRYWSLPTLHPQKPFEYFRQCFLLHLPGDKKFLADLEPMAARDRDSFLAAYTPYQQQRHRKSYRQKQRSALKQWIKSPLKQSAIARN